MRIFITSCLFLFSITLVNTLALAGTGEKSFTPTGYRYPIMKIAIAEENSQNMQNLYTCPGSTPAECMVDLSDQSALDAIQAQAQNVEIRIGTYTELVLNNCPAGTTGSNLTAIQVKGSVSAGGISYRTSTNETSGLSVGGAEEFTEIPWGCAGAALKLITPVVVAENSAQALTLNVDLTNVLWTVPNSALQGGCKGILQGRGVCSAAPVVVPFVGTGTSTFERYLMSHRSDSATPDVADVNAAVNLVVDPNGEVYYVIVQPYFSETSPSTADALKGGPDYNTTTRSYTKNSATSVSFQTGGSVEDNRVGFADFKRETHLGTCKNEQASAQVWNYRAIKQ